jgi:hypothetical protein
MAKLAEQAERYDGNILFLFLKFEFFFFAF